MKRTALLSLLALSVAAHAADSSHRLAYSKAENVEVFVDHPAGQPWCSEALQLRFAFAGSASQQAVERLMPKLGGLLANQCAQATHLSWSSRDQQGQLKGQGVASKAGGWLALAGQATPASPMSADTAVAKPAAAPAAVSSSASPIESVPVSADPTPAPEPAAAPPEAPSTTAAAPTVASAPAPVPAQPSAAAPAPAAPAAEPQAAEPVAQTDAAAEAALVAANLGFTVAGWKPQAERDALAKASLLNVVKDQHGCQFRLNYRPDVAAEFLVVESSGVSCGADGYASGAGELLLKRSDGVQLKRIKAHFRHGLPITDGDSDLPIVELTDKGDLLLLVNSDPQHRVYHLLRASYNSYHGGWSLQDSLLLALTENVELFRNQQSIQDTLLQPIARLSHLRPNLSRIRSYAMDNLSKGLFGGDRDYWLYEIALHRPWRSKQWKLNPNNATNHLFQREQRRAEVARREAERKAREEQRQRETLAYAAEEQLRNYRSLEEQAKRPEELARQLVRDIDPRSGYRALMNGDSRPISQIVQVSGKADSGWRIDYPYEAELHGNASLSEGWYLVSGKVSLDPQRRDGHELPLTLIEAEVVEPCEEVGCRDRMQPLTLMRQRLKDPDWSPQQAIAQVRAAWPDRYPQSADQEQAQ